MTNIKNRITKAPEERRLEMLETAMQLFTQNGYEQTTMRDIANKMNIVPGLCYRYFDSKQALYQEAVAEYAKEYAAPLISILNHAGTNLTELRNTIAQHFSKSTDMEKYHKFFHKPENHDHAIILNHTICELVVPHMVKALTQLSETGVIHISDADGYARFLLYGIIAIFDDDTKSFSERMALVDEILNKLYEKKGDN